jgi:acetolactate synthase small subunit
MINALEVPRLEVPINRDGVKLLAEACAKLGMPRDEWTRSTTFAAAAFNKQSATKKQGNVKKASKAERELTKPQDKQVKTKNLNKFNGFYKLLETSEEIVGKLPIQLPDPVRNASDWKSLISNVTPAFSKTVTDIFEKALIVCIENHLDPSVELTERRKSAINYIHKEAGMFDDEIRASRAYFPKFPSIRAERATTNDNATGANTTSGTESKDKIASATTLGNTPGTPVDPKEE